MNSIQRFEEMVSVARTNGIFSDPKIGVTKEYLTKMFWEIVSDAELFMFHSEGETKEIPDEVGENVLQDAPFKNFSFELYDRPITSPTSAEFIIGTDLTIWSIVGHELAPYDYLFFIFCDFRGEKRVVGTKNAEIEYICQENFKKISRWDAGMEFWNRKIKMASGPRKFFRKINRIIHIVPRNRTVAMQSGFNEIIYDYRFSVRGHWRRLQEGQIGKDRAGNKCVLGFTWISEFEKGDKNLPKLNRVRVVDENVPNDGVAMVKKST